MAATPADYRLRARNLATQSSNKIHDDGVARQFGFTGALVPGVDLFAYLTHPLVEAWGRDFLDRGRLAVRFRRPVYDGDDVVVRAHAQPDGSLSIALTGESDDDVRSAGTAWPPASPAAQRRAYTATPPAAQQLPIGPDPLPMGALGSVEEPATRERHDAYLAGLDEQLAIYRDEQLLHPGAVLRAVNEVLVRNVALGPWIHTASDCQFLGVATVPTTLRVHAVVTDRFERNGNAYVRYDAVVLAAELPVAEVDHTAIYRLAGASG